MRCQICKKNEATVHLTQIAGDKTQQIADLCSECAEANGIKDAASLSLKAVLPLLK
jgi:protein-arginine kinase activator protein McsA